MTPEQAREKLIEAGTETLRDDGVPDLLYPDQRVFQAKRDLVDLQEHPKQKWAIEQATAQIRPLAHHCEALLASASRVLNTFLAHPEALITLLVEGGALEQVGWKHPGRFHFMTMAYRATAFDQPVYRVRSSDV